MVIEGRQARGQNLKELLEFMDAPGVQVATPDDWRSCLGERRLAAIFLGDDLQPNQIDRLIADVGELDPNAPIVLVTENFIAGPSSADSGDPDSD